MIQLFPHPQLGALPFMKFMYSYLLMDAANLGLLNNVVHILHYYSSLAQSPTWFQTESEGIRCNALEVAILRGFEQIVVLLEEAGCAVSDEFLESIIASRSIYVAIHNSQNGTVRCLLRVLRLQMYGPAYRSRSPISDALECLRMQKAQNEYAMTRNFQEDYTLDSIAIGSGVQEAIDYLLEDRNTHLSRHEIQML